MIPMFDSVKTISWSLIPGMGTHLFMSDGRLERKRFRVFCSLVGKLTDCIRPRSFSMDKKVSLIAIQYWCPLIEFEDQDISGRLKSPVSHIVEFLYLKQISLMMEYKAVAWSGILLGGR